MDWNDLRLVLEVFREGSVRGAALALGVSQSTVSRRLRALEQVLQSDIFQRLSSGWIPTPLGREIVLVAKRTEVEILGLTVKVSKEALPVEGVLRVSVPESLLSLVTPIVADFLQLHQGLSVDLVVGRSDLGILGTEAHVGVSMHGSPDPQLDARKLAQLWMAPYASVEYLKKADKRSAQELEWVAWERGRSALRPTRWVQSNVPDERIRCRVSSQPAMMEAARAGLGVALVSCYSAQRWEQLVMVPEAAPVFSLDIWVLTRPELRELGKVSGFLTFMSAALGARREALEPGFGRRQRSAS